MESQPQLQPFYVNKVVSGPGWYRAKIALGVSSVVTCIIVLGLGGSLVSEFPRKLDAYFGLICGCVPVRRRPQRVLAGSGTAVLTDGRLRSL